MIKQSIMGNYELTVRIRGADTVPAARIKFSGSENLVSVFLDIDNEGFRVVRQVGSQSTVLRDYPFKEPLPWTIRLLKKGNFFRYQVNGESGWIRGPSGEWNGQYESWENTLEVDGSLGCIFESCTVRTLPWLSQKTNPIISRGPVGSYYEKQIIPGAILEVNGRFYMYCMAGMEGDQEGSSRRTVVVAESDDLLSWDVSPTPVLSYKDVPGDNIYVNGAVVSPNGKFVIMYALQQYPSWLGFMIATADDPRGPFIPFSDNPVHKHFNDAAHEFDLQQVDHPDYRYIMFYAGYTKVRSGDWPGGDRGFLLYSDNLVDWREDECNPVFGPETIDNWDAVHVRPRSLNRINDTWYLWYEGCNAWTPPVPNGQLQWCDTVGLARSKDLRSWDYYPRNPALPALGLSSECFEHTWTGWPRMVVKDGMGYLFYTGNAQVGLRTIPIALLSNWDDEGGELLRML